MLVPLLFAITPAEAEVLAETDVQTSGTVSQTQFTTQQIIDHAFRRAGIQPSTISGENLETAQELLYLVMSPLASRGIALWCVEKQLIGLNEGVTTAQCADGTVDVLNVNLRTTTRISGTALNGSLVAVPNTNDGDIETSQDFGALGGSVTITFDEESQTTCIGLLPGIDAEWDLIVECQQAGVWSEVANATVTVQDSQWVWFPVEGVVRGTAARVTVATGASFILREFFVGGSSRETPLYKMNRSDYATMPQKESLGTPVQFWLDKRRTQATLTLWPTPNSAQTFNHLLVYSQRHVQDVGELSQIIEVPQRWYLAIIALLAKELALEMPGVDPVAYDRCSMEAERRLAEAWSSETDSSRMSIRFNLSRYS